MTLIIDGHNLIGVMPDIRLGDPDDELLLLKALRAYRAQSGAAPMIVFFDSGEMPARIPDLSTPGVQARFAAPGEIADDAIITYLRKRPEPGQYAVVTNDQGLSWRARDAGANVIRADDFVAKLMAERKKTPASQPGALPFDPRDPVFADIYRGFLETEKGRGRGAAKPNPDDVAAWVEKLYGDDVELAQRAARWLGQHGGDVALAALRDALTHNDVRVRAAALLALGALGNRAALPDLCERLIHDAGSLAREAAAQSLGLIGNRSVEPALEAAIKNDAKGKVRKAAQAALAEIRARRGGTKDEG